MELWKIIGGFIFIAVIVWGIVRSRRDESPENDVRKYEQEKCNVAVKRAHATNPGNREAAEAQLDEKSRRDKKRKEEEARLSQQPSQDNSLTNVVLIHAAASSVEAAESTQNRAVETPTPAASPDPTPTHTPSPDTGGGFSGGGDSGF